VQFGFEPFYQAVPLHRFVHLVATMTLEHVTVKSETMLDLVSQDDDVLRVREESGGEYENIATREVKGTLECCDRQIRNKA
jgi:hypothetical protein